MMRLLKIIKSKWHPEPIVPDRTEERHEAQKAKENARLVLRETKEQGRDITKIAESLRTLRERNHFGDAIEAAMQPRRRK